ncbi:MarR family winged helix-turn-helix transcriptional regulator [Actinomadura sp. HBU206391]|uniref:MarR family winged helix-turn-helix transcriptional regulator n=1 Tax=Actinomadura sp. HBU206391 TaxID=2731692 RepID=UPI00164FD8AB|nr:MarR family winged helix-turn-helix transcriptional regulator [Actinomadura sp. HBU206391]MBC6456576.1 winged helix-turn-helix transcriptional regulator [Actinomadura sp. HBU206391]
MADEFGRTSKLLGGRLTNRLVGHELSMPRAQLLVESMRSGPLRITELGGRIGISQGTVSTLAEALVREGLLERRADPRDGRATQVIITEAGRRRAAAWLHDYEIAAEEVFSALPAKQWSALLAALRTLSAGGPGPDEE